MPERAINPSQVTTTPPATPVTTPLHAQGVQEHSFSVQYLYDTQRSLGRIETSIHKLEEAQGKLARESDVDRLTKSLDTLIAKVDANCQQIATGRGMLITVKWFLAGIGALLLVLLGMLAHHFGYA